MTRYELFERVGAGGMAEIFRGKAVAAGGFEKPVAIKRILPHLSQDRRFVELLIAEAKILSQLRHRNIVQIFDVGLGDDDQYFLVMEFVDGVDVGAVQRSLETRRKRLPLDLVLHIGAEVCEALEHAHTTAGPDGKPMRLVHRDVSPSNILLSRAGEVKLTDFGIAKRPEEHTGHGAVRGKFAYISPEQAENRHVDARSDVFSLGLVLYELAVGRRLFSQLPDLDALRAVREAKVPRPRELDPRMPVDVEDALMSALAKDPTARIGSAGEFGAKLRAIRYGLEQAAGDPALELSRVVEGAATPRPAPASVPKRTEDARAEANRTARGKRLRPESLFSSGESTVVRIKTADVFAAPDADGTAILRARQVIDRFEEEETRLSKAAPPDWGEERTTGPDRHEASDPDADPTDDGLDEETRVMGGVNRRGAAVDALAVLARGKRGAAAPVVAAALPARSGDEPRSPPAGNRTDRIAKVEPSAGGARAAALIIERAAGQGAATVDVRGAHRGNLAARDDGRGADGAAKERTARLNRGDPSVPTAARVERGNPAVGAQPGPRGPIAAGRPEAGPRARGPVGHAPARAPSPGRRIAGTRWIGAIVAGAAIAGIAITAAIVAGNPGPIGGRDAGAPPLDAGLRGASAHDAGAAARPGRATPDARPAPLDAGAGATAIDGGAAADTRRSPPPAPVAKPAVAKPAVAKPAVAKPAVAKPPVKKPPAKKPPVKKPSR
jgi:serine/threonine-protein kinase